MGNLGEQLCRVDDTGWIVRGVQNQSAGACRDGSFQTGNLRKKGFGIGRNNHHASIEVVDVVGIFSEEGRKYNHLIAGIEQRLEDNIQSSGRSAGHDDVFTAQAAVVLAIEMLGDGLPNLGVAGIVHISVDGQRIFLRQNFRNGLSNLVRWGDAGVADAEIKDIFSAVN